MAVTNAQIIFFAAQKLLEEGKIQGTGRTIIFEMPTGETIEAPEPEAIHTFAAWKARGYKVRKGEHAVARITIWKYGKDKVNEEKPDEEPGGHCFLKESCFFAASQVEPA